jgi:hypothetical protein
MNEYVVASSVGDEDSNSSNFQWQLGMFAQ